MPYFGEILSVAAALFWAMGVIFFKRSGETMLPISLNLFKNSVAMILYVPSMLLIGQEFRPHFAPDVEWEVWVLLVTSGVIGIAIADTLFFVALNKLGAGLTAVVDTAYSPIILLLSFLMLSESIGGHVVFGAGLIVVALLLSSKAKPIPGRTRRDVIQGTVVAIVGLVSMGVGIVIAKPVLNDVPVLWASSVRMAAGIVGLIPLALASPARKKIVEGLMPGPHWKLAVPGAVLGTYLALLAWIGGMKYTLVSRAAVLNQLSTIFIFVLAIVFLREPATKRRVAAILLAVSGALLVVLSAD